MPPERSGSLVVVGTGYHIAGQTTPEAIDSIRDSDSVFYLVYDAATEYWIRSLNPSAISLQKRVRAGLSTVDRCNAMVDRIMAAVRRGLNVCAAFPGHPSICLYPSHEAVRRARLEGFTATILPAVSAIDCMFADLGVDPVRDGCRVMDASAFLIYEPKPQTSSALVLVRAAVIGKSNIKVLKTALRKSYGPSHEVVLYETAANPLLEARMQHVTLSTLDKQEIRFQTTLYIPPLNG